MKIIRKQSEVLDLIKDKRVREVFECVENLEDNSECTRWAIFLKHADKFDTVDPCEVVESTEETYFLDNERLVSFLNKYYGKDSGAKKAVFDCSPDGRRFYLNNIEVDVKGTLDGNFKLVVNKTLDTFVIDVKETENDLELFNRLVVKIPFVNWEYSNLKGISVGENRYFKSLDSAIEPVVLDGEVELREIVTLEPSLKDKWIVRIKPCIDCCDLCEESCD